MHFIFEALHKRPLEKRSLAVSRGVTAILMGLAFLAYVGYLIYQVYNDRTLLILSSIDIPDSGYPSPDIEICYPGNWTFARCSFQAMDWSINEIPGCEGHYRDGNYNGDEMCRVFQANFTNFGIASKGPNDPTIRRVDIYWRLDNATAAAALYPTIPSIPLSLYDQSFSTWRLNEDEINAMIPKQQFFFNATKLGAYKGMSMQNHSSAIFFYPKIYRAIRPGDVASLFGFNTSLVNINTFTISQHDWPLHPSENLTRGDYHGFFSIQLAATNIEIQTEQRQHTILAALALMGGAYGVLTTIYIVVFGTPRLTPWGVVHRFPLVLSRGKNKLGLNNDGYDPNNNQAHPLQNTAATGTSTSVKLPLLKRWKQKFTYTPTHMRDDISDEYLNPNYKSADTFESISNHPTRSTTTSSQPSPNNNYNNNNYSDDDPATIKNVATIEDVNDVKDAHSMDTSVNYNSLEYRIEELEMILREYFLNVEYLDALRLRYRQQRQFMDRSDLPLYNDSIHQPSSLAHQQNNANNNININPTTTTNNNNNNNNNNNHRKSIRQSITPLPQKAFVLPNENNEKPRKSFAGQRERDGDEDIINNSRISIPMDEIHQDDHANTSSQKP
ncbi:unnamed protein product [Cunninghamella blakesleeana]